MSFREQIVVQILLLVARMIADDEGMAGEIKTLATRISVHGKEATTKERVA